MKAVFIILILSLCLTSLGSAQKRKKRPAASKPPAAEPKPVPPSIGGQVVIVTKNGDRLSGTLVDLTLYSVKIKSDGLDSTIALDTLASISFGSALVGSASQQPAAPQQPDFDKDLNSTLGALQSIGAQLNSGVDYTEYGRLLAELRPKVERFVGKYSTSQNATETRSAGLLAGALTDYTWARTVWTLKLGRSSDGTVAETDSPTVVDALTLYPDLRAASASANRFSGDKLVRGLWNKAAEKVEKARPTPSTGR
jgi:hypothetical protein